MPSWIEFRLGCRGLYRLALFDRSFTGFFDRSTAGVLRSFGLFLLLLPIVLWQVWLTNEPPADNPVLFLAGRSVAYAYNWILFPFLIVFAARFLERDAEAAGCVAIYNWTNVLWVALQMPTTLIIGLGVSVTAAQLLGLALLIASVVIEGFMFLVVLRLVLWQAGALVALDFLLSLMVIWPMGDWLSGVK
jgi:hypothetical protein